MPALLALLALSAGASPGLAQSAASSGGATRAHLGVASCSGSTCHGRQEADGKVVRQDELLRWQEPSSDTGAHSRAYNVLTNARSAEIAQRLGIGSAPSAPMCLGCHVAPARVRNNGAAQLSDGVGCETCHGSAGGWIASHYAVGATHQRNVSQGLIPLENPKARAAVCLDCHFGSSEDNQFVNHRIMAAGHPRISFELDLFSTLQQHHNEDSDYVRRKGRSNSFKTWAVGQAMALDRALDVFSDDRRGMEGIFPEFYFFDCHSCHRRIYDRDEAISTVVRNPGRPIPEGMPPFNDENMIMLSAAAAELAPGLARQFDADSKAFHLGLSTGRSRAVAAGRKLQATVRQLADALAGTEFGRDRAFAVLDRIASNAISDRFTDYEGSVQAVMAVDTLLNAMVSSGYISTVAAAGIRGNVNTAYEAVNDPNDYRPLEFRRALGTAIRTIRTLR